MKVAEILVESKQVKNIEEKDFPVLMKYLKQVKDSASNVKRWDRVKDFINSAIAAGEVLNTQLPDIKRSFDYLIDAAYEPVEDQYTRRGQYEKLPEELQYLSTPYGLYQVNSFSKKLAKLKDSKDEPAYKAFVELTNELLQFHDAMEYIKTITVKASEKKAEAKAARVADAEEYQKKYTNHKDVQKVMALLKGKSAEVEKGVYESQLKSLTRKVDAWKKDSANSENITDPSKLYKSSPEFIFILQRVLKRVGGYSSRDKSVWELENNWVTIIDKMAKDHAAYVVDRFVYKNAGKLSYLLFTKNNMKAVELKDVDVGSGVVEAKLAFEFDDGSSFTAQSSVVGSYSKLGKYFYRFPTLFRFVKMPDGTKLASPSEQRMDEIFAITK